MRMEWMGTSGARELPSHSLLVGSGLKLRPTSEPLLPSSPSLQTINAIRDTCILIKTGPRAVTSCPLKHNFSGCLPSVRCDVQRQRDPFRLVAWQCRGSNEMPNKRDTKRASFLPFNHLAQTVMSSHYFSTTLFLSTNDVFVLPPCGSHLNNGDSTRQSCCRRTIPIVVIGQFHLFRSSRPRTQSRPGNLRRSRRSGISELKWQDNVSGFCNPRRSTDWAQPCL